LRSTVLSADGIPVQYEVAGSGSPALVFVHGWSCDRSYWRGQVGYFAGRYQVVTIDLAGHGQSGLGRRGWTMPGFGADVVAVMEHLKLPQMVLIGHSMGGDVIVETARLLPARVIGLVWVDTYRTLGEPDSEEAVERFVAPFRAEFVATTRDFVRGMFAAGADPDLIEWVAADMSAAPAEVALDAMKHAIGNEPAVRAGLAEVAAPVVAINPDHPPTDVDALARYGVETVLISGVGHFPMMEDPDAFNYLLDKTITGFPPVA
jgi:pimeloyl-ACP methyl ester carboxylesterase